MTDQFPLPLPHNETLAPEDYHITSSNRDAARWVYAWPEWPSHCLVIYGPLGGGKSHLLHVWLQHSQGTLISLEDLRLKDAGGLAARHSAIAIDDVDRIAGNREMEKNLFHLYNYVRENKGFLLLTMTKPPVQWVEIADLKSRLLAAPAATIGAPDDELLSMLLVKQFRDRQIEIGADVIAYIVPRVERTAEALRELVAALDQASLAEGRKVSINLAKRVLEYLKVRIF